MKEKGIIGGGRNAVGLTLLVCVALFLVSFLLENMFPMGSPVRIAGIMMHLLTIFILLFVYFKVMKELTLSDIKEAIKDEIERIQRRREFIRSTITVVLSYRQLRPIIRTLYSLWTVVSIVFMIAGIADIIGLIPGRLLMYGPNNTYHSMPHYVSGILFLLFGFVIFSARILIMEKTLEGITKLPNMLQ